MGIGAELSNPHPVEEAHGETNGRQDALVAEQKLTNELLEWLGSAIQQPGGIAAVPEWSGMEGSVPPGERRPRWRRTR